MVRTETQDQFSSTEEARLARFRRQWQPDGSHDHVVGDDRLSESEPKKERVVQYNRNFDIQKYKAVNALQFTNPELYQQRIQALDAQTLENLETALGERLNASISKRRDDIENGHLVDRNTHESLLDMFKRGQEWRAKNGSLPHDQMREAAEVIGFTKVDRVFNDENTPIGTMMFSRSEPGRPGSRYQHNFYDVFTLKIDEKGERYNEAQRFVTGLDPKEFRKKMLQLLDPTYADAYNPKLGIPLDTYMLMHPIKLLPGTTKYTSAEDLHGDFHIDSKSLPLNIYTETVRRMKPYGKYYIQSLKDDSDNIEEGDLRFKAYFNIAEDEIVNEVTEDINNNVVFQHADQEQVIRRDHIVRSGNQAMRIVQTACGESGDSGSQTAYSVAEYGQRCKTCGQPEADNHYHCPKTSCSKKYADETKLPANMRTKKCSCGFEFHCE